ncbi:MAG: hypothetical protein N3E39_04565, partial [Candidatus Methanomethylicia archaeon]|nr:hypothetical protein [Candidatus Methanomethylicia archaeon]
MSNKKLLLGILLLLAILVVSMQPVAAETESAKLALRFVDQKGGALKGAFVRVYNKTGNYLLFEGRTDAKGWLNVTIKKPLHGIYNMTVWWDPLGKDAFIV